MSDSTVIDAYASVDNEFRDPLIHKPPVNKKVQLYTTEGITTTGTWYEEGCLAWAPMTKVPGWLKKRKLERWGVG